jgi:head-tail adaptor
MFDPGLLNKKVQVLAPTLTAGGSGEAIYTWGEVGNYWAAVDMLGGSETTQSDVYTPIFRAKFTFRYITTSTITEKCRFVWNSQTWNIISVAIVGQKEYKEFICDTNTSQTGDSTDYGDYYKTNSLKIRQVTASAVTSLTPTQAQISSDIGLTAVTAGAGYLAMIHIHALSKNLLVESDGTDWYYAYVSATTPTSVVDYIEGAMAGLYPTGAEVTTAVGVTPAAAGAGYFFLGKFTRAAPAATAYLFIGSDGTNWIGNTLLTSPGVIS